MYKLLEFYNIIKKKSTTTKNKRAILFNFFKTVNLSYINNFWVTYVTESKRFHKWHLVSPSPWPLFSAFSSFILLVGLALWMYRISSTLEYPFSALKFGFICVILSMYVWFRDISRESSLGYHTFSVQWNLRSGFFLFIISEIMFFFSFFWSYFHSAVDPSIWLGDIWPPEGFVNFFLCENILDSSYIGQVTSETFYDNIIFGNNENIFYTPTRTFFDWTGLFTKPSDFLSLFNFEYTWLAYMRYRWTDKYMSDRLFIYFNLLNYIPEDTYDSFRLNNLNLYLPFDIHINLYDKGLLLNPYKIPLLNTLLLLTSGATLTLSHLLLRLERFTYSISALGLTIILAIFFIFIQLFEFITSFFSINDNSYGGIFFMLTGFHGFHVLVGTFFLIVCLIRMYSLQFTRSFHFGFEAAIWYWHFVDVVWIFLYVFIYIWPCLYFFSNHYNVAESSPLGNEFMPFFNDMYISLTVDEVIPDTLLGTNSYTEIWEYFTKKQNIELICSSKTVISAAEAFDNAVGLKLRSQVIGHQSNQDGEPAIFLFFKLKKVIFASNLPVYSDWHFSFCKNAYFFETFKNNIIGSDKISLLHSDAFCLKNRAMSNIIRLKFAYYGSELLSPRFIWYYV